ncbi:MAG TPA: hypothetical protein PLZ95_12905 [Bryobacteraceae bacterium]|nr:hypothetical protein [Bryobacteraceae bacterium]
MARTNLVDVGKLAGLDAAFGYSQDSPSRRTDRLIPFVILCLPIFLSIASGQDKGSTPQTKVLTVCEALKDVRKLNREMVAVQGWFSFTHRHGGYLTDQRQEGRPCDNLSGKARNWLSAIRLDSTDNPNLDDGPVAFRAEPPTYGDLIDRFKDADGNVDYDRRVLVTLLGEIRTKKRLKILNLHDSETGGNGYGSAGAFAAVLVVKSCLNPEAHPPR